MFIAALPLYGKLVLLALVAIVIFAILKKFVKLAIYIAALTILVLEILKLAQ
jgi:hypothetical protein